MFVYLLSVYEEHGSYAVVATLDNSKLLEMFDTYIKAWEGYPKASLAKMKEKLIALIEKHKKTGIVFTEGKNLSKGWGGLQLHIIKLQ